MHQYEGQDLRKANFQGQDLRGADFSNADLRGTRFTNAQLRDSCFRDARFGLPLFKRVLVLLFAAVLVIGAGWLTGFTISSFWDENSELWRGNQNRVAAGFALGFAGFFLACTVFYGLLRALWIGVASAPVVLILSWGVQLLAGQSISIERELKAVSLVGLLAVSMIAGLFGRVISGNDNPVALVGVGLLGGLSAGQASGGILGVVIMLSLVVVAKRTLRHDPRDELAPRLVDWISRHSGTDFSNSDLTSADFEGARVKHASFDGASLAGTNWEGATSRPASLSSPTG